MINEMTRMDSESNPHSILVLDANQRSALAVTRSLGKHYPEAAIITADCVPRALAGASRYSSKYIQHPDPASNPNAFIEWMQQHCQANLYDLIVPTTEITSQCLLLAADELPDLPLPFAEYETVMKLADKSELVKAAEDVGIPTPLSAFFSHAGELPPLEEFVFPVVLKPSLSKIRTENGWITTTVRVIKDKTALESVLETDTYLQQHPFMLQEFIPGHGAGLFCLFNKGQPVQFFAHQRVREKPPEGGVSVLSQAAPVDIQLMKLTSTLLKSCKWHGVAMVEFRIDCDGKPYLMEVNTRFWGSLQLAIDSGVNFPAQLADLYFGKPVQPVVQYNHNQRLRWLLGDLDSLYLYLKGPYSKAQKRARIWSFLTPRLSDQRHETNRLNDFKPFISELVQYLEALRG